jgi:hypothetical protein
VVGGVVGIAAQVGLDEDRPAAGGGEIRSVLRAADAANRGEARQARLERALGGARGGGIARADEDALGDRLAESGGGDLAVGARGFAGALLGVGELLGSRHRAGEREGDDEQQPQGDHAARAPRGGAGDASHGAGERAVWGVSRRHAITIAARARSFVGARWRLGAAVPRTLGGVFPTPGPWGELSERCACV